MKDKEIVYRIGEEVGDKKGRLFLEWQVEGDDHWSFGTNEALNEETLIRELEHRFRGIVCRKETTKG
jgi:hypothetical protein